MKKMLLTGATGFVGSRLAKSLIESGYKLNIIVRPSSSLKELSGLEGKYHLYKYDGSLASLKYAIKESRPKVVIHLASLFIAEHDGSQVDDLISSNVLFGTQLLEAMNEFDVKKLINTGTSWQHYNNEGYNPVNLYAATKQAFESIIEYYVQACDFSVITLKLFDTYGPNDPRKKLMSLLDKMAATQETLDMSGGEQEINLVHIDDVCSAYLKSIRIILGRSGLKNKKYAISSKEVVTVKELVKVYESVKKVKLNIRWGMRSYRKREVMNLWSCFDTLPDWNAKKLLKDGLVSQNEVR